MKVKLVTQLLTSSVADSLMFYKNVLKLEKFKCYTATANFIRLFNDAFDILNSRTLISYGFKRALNYDNYDKIFSFIQQLFFYVQHFKLNTGQPILKSQRSTGFLDFLVCFRSLFNPKKAFIDSN